MIRVIRIINKVSPFVIIIRDVNDVIGLSLQAMSASRLQVNKWLGILNDHIEFGVCKRPCRFGIAAGGLTPRNVTETSLAHRFLASGEIEGSREGYCLTFASMGHRNGQRSSS